MSVTSRQTREYRIGRAQEPSRKRAGKYERAGRWPYPASGVFCLGATSPATSFIARQSTSVLGSSLNNRARATSSVSDDVLIFASVFGVRRAHVERCVVESFRLGVLGRRVLANLVAQFQTRSRDPHRVIGLLCGLLQPPKVRAFGPVIQRARFARDRLEKFGTPLAKQLKVGAW
jgi:hypothetical protein